ncbi:MAG: amino acid permease [Micrococcaceae bacterium]
MKKNIEKDETVGLPVATTLVMGSIIGSGVFSLPSAMAAYGPLSLIAFTVVSVGAFCLAGTFSLLSKKNKRSGGEYVFAQEAFGDFAGFLVAWCVWIASWVATAAVTVAMVGYVETFINKDHNPIGSILIGLVGIWVPAIITLTGIKNMGNIQFAFTVIKYIPILLVGVLGLFHMKAANFGAFNPSGEPAPEAMLLAAAICIYSYLGVESISAITARVRNPKKNVPKATMYGIGLTALLYLVTLVGVMGTVPHDKLVKSTAPFVDSTNAIFGGTWSGNAVAVIAIFSCFGLLVGWILITAEVPAEAASNGLFPKVFANLNKKNVPTTGVVISTIFPSLLLVFAYTEFAQVFQTMVALAVTVTVLPYIFTASAQLYWLFVEAKKGNKHSGWGKNMGIVVGALIFAFSGLMGSGQQAVYLGAIMAFLGVPIYAYMQRNVKVTPVKHEETLLKIATDSNENKTDSKEFAQ